ncbi:hypothetical protein B0H21DRAFT_696993, partial [Amylocystis lapponica]
DIYANELITLGHGHPLWYPEPSRAGEVEIGDVGPICNGQSLRLFNATKPADHEFNKDGVPNDFKHFELNTRLHIQRDGEIPQGFLNSRGVTAVNVGAQVAA